MMDISNMDIKDLKALAYDINIQMLNNQKDLGTVEKRIVELQKSALPKHTIDRVMNDIGTDTKQNRTKNS
jgi:hypothetical protein